MSIVSGRTLTLSGQQLATSSIQALLRRIDDADEVSFQLNAGFSADLLKIVMLAAALSRRERRVSVYFANGGPSDGVRESLAQTLLGPIFGFADQSREGIPSQNLGFRQRGYVDPKRRILCVPSGRLDCASRDGFLNDLSDGMRSADILVHEAVLTRVAALAFEPNQNAEEHGCTRIGDMSHVFRCTVVRVHDQPGPALPADAHEYIRTYHENGHTERTRWLELIVADAGMGLAFPLFYVRASAAGSVLTDVYGADHVTEHGVFSEVLGRQGTTTKGYWGTVRSAQTTTGQGHQTILRNVLRLHAYASVRAGRCQGSIAYPKRNTVSENELKQAAYDVDVQVHEMFGGTVWHMLVPLDQQLTLDL